MAGAGGESTLVLLAEVRGAPLCRPTIDVVCPVANAPEPVDAKLSTWAEGDALQGLAMPPTVRMYRLVSRMLDDQVGPVLEERFALWQGALGECPMEIPGMYWESVVDNGMLLRIPRDNWPQWPRATF